MRSHLRIIPKTERPAPAPYDDARCRKAIEGLRRRLLAEAVRFVVQGATKEKGNAIPDRIRDASDLTGIPRVLIAAEVGR